MTTEIATRYLSLEEGQFVKVAGHLKIRPVEVGEEVSRWRKSDLDLLVKRLPTVPAFVGETMPPRSLKLHESEIGKIAEAVANKLGGEMASHQRALVSIKQAGAILGVPIPPRIFAC